MRFRKSEEASKTVAFPGRAEVLDGYSALLEAERAAGEVLIVAPEHRAAGFPVPEAEPTFVDNATGTTGSPARADHLRVEEASAGRDIPALLAGSALRGLRASALVTASDTLPAALAAAAGRRLPFLVHLAGRAQARQAASTQGSHDGYHALADSGAFLLFAKNAQEVADYAFIARRISERALTPGVCAHDRYATSHAVCNIEVPGADLAGPYLGRASDTIPGPTDAQRLVFGDTRRRVPLLLDADHPAGIGAVQETESYFRAAAAGRVFFSDDLAAMVDDAMQEFGALSGREYRRAVGYRLEDAEYVIVAQGAVVDELVPVVDFLRGERKIKAGLLNIAVLRPFPGAPISRLLAGKKAVTVLECTDSPLAEDTPLLCDVRAAIDRAAENGAARTAGPVHPDYAAYRHRDDRPFLLSGVYGVGTALPSFAQLAAVFENMTRDAAPRHFYLGAGFDVETRRFPHLQTLRQRLEREYPRAAWKSLDAAPAALDPRRNDGSLLVVSPSAQGALFAGNLFARALAAATGWSVHTYPDGGVERTLQPVRLALAFQRKPGVACTRPILADAVLVSGEQLIETVAAGEVLRREGTLIAGSVQAPEVLWRGLSRRAADWVREGAIPFHVLDARRVAAETTMQPSFVDQLSIWALLGAVARIHLGLSAEQFARLEQSLRDQLRTAPGMDDASAAEVAQTFRRGSTECTPVPWAEWSDVAHPVGEPETPWTVRETGAHDNTVFDAARFWQSVGYLYDRGQAASTLADPYLATGILPARSSAFRDMTPHRLQLPAWLPEKCTGCGACWAQCPESALPATVRTLPELVTAAMEAGERSSGAFVQLKRLADNLARFAARAVAQGGPQPWQSLPALLADAFARLVDKAGLDGDKLIAARAEFERLCATIEGFPVAVTEAFFTKPEGASAGSGRVLSITLNPMACSACGICIAECADGALEWTAQTPERVLAARRDWDFLMQLPPLREETIAALVSAEDSGSHVNRLLDGAVYHSLIGGDGSLPGNGARTAVHLVTAAIESVVRPRFAAHAAHLSSLVTRIEDRIQGRIQSGFRVNDFEEFSRRLQRLDRNEITPAALMGVMGDDGRTIDAARLTRLSQLLRDLRELQQRYAAGRARFVMTIDPDPDAFWSGTYPFNPHPQPWAAQEPGDAVGMAVALSEALARQTAAELSLCRRAEAEINDAPLEEAEPPGWDQLTDDERALVPRVLVLTRPGTASAEGMWNVLARRMPITIALLDGDGIATADVNSAGARLDALVLALARDGRSVSQGSIGAPGHLIRSVVDSLAGHGPSLVRVYAPDPVTSGVAPERIAELARTAVEARAVPVYAVSGRQLDTTGGKTGPGILSLDGNPDPDRAWAGAKLDVLDAAGTNSVLDVTRTVADWAAMQARFRRHFRVVSRGHRSDRTRHLAAYLALDARAREGIQPYIDLRDQHGHHAIALVSREMTAMVERAASRWNDLQSAAPAGGKPRAAKEAPAAAAAPAAAPAPADVHRALAENLLRLSGYGSDDPFFRRSLREFVARGRGSNGDAE